MSPYTKFMKKILLISAALLLAPIAFAQDAVERDFIEKRYKIEGTLKIDVIENQTRITLSDDFKTKNGPDLKLFLTKKPVADLTGDDVISTGLKLGVLKSNKGGQSYIIPEDVDLSQYESLVIHCEAFTVLWGGVDL